MIAKLKRASITPRSLLLAGLFVAFAGALAWALAPPAIDPEMILSPPEAHAASDAGDHLLIDIRTPAEWRETGIPAGAATADFNGLGSGESFIARIAALVDGDRSAPVALICARGGRSGRAVRLLREAGFTDVRDVHEGMLGNGDGPGWLARGLPVESVE